MQNTDAFERDWRDRGLGCPLHREMTFTQAGVVLGRGTLLAEFEKKGRASRGLAFDGEEARLLSLLAAAHGKPVAEGVIAKIRRAGELWCAGEKALAQIHLAFLGLPKLDEADAYRLFLAATALEKGLDPRELVKALGFPRAALELEKYNPDQPRVPAGSGRESGEWTTGDGGSSGGSKGGLPPNRHIEIVRVRLVDEPRPDADFHGLVSDAQYTQLPSAPIITPKIIEKILTEHGATAAPEDGQFIEEYRTEQKIRELIEGAWEKATPADVGAGRWGGGVVIAGSVFEINTATGEKTPYIIGTSGNRKSAPSVQTNTYVVVLDSDMKVKSCYPINPEDEVNPRNE